MAEAYIMDRFEFEKLDRLTGLVPGQPCPTCGRKVPMTGAERQRRWRARRLRMRKDFYAKTTHAGMKAAGLS